jgi:hypothetical protein
MWRVAMDREENEKIKNETRELEKKLKLKGKLSWDRQEEREKEEIFLCRRVQSLLDGQNREGGRAGMPEPKEVGFQEAQRSGGKILLPEQGETIVWPFWAQRRSPGGPDRRSHIDSRIDSSKPLYEEADMAPLRTYYYGESRSVRVTSLCPSMVWW